MRILATGGAGYIGSHTAVELIRSGHDVELLDDLSNARADVPERIGRITGHRPVLHVADIRDETALDAALAGGFDAVLHFAALKSVGDSVRDPLRYYDVNVGGSATLLRVMDRLGIRTLVFSSSATVYGDATEIPVTEDAPLLPAANPYGRTKQIIELMLADLVRADPRWGIGMLRYFNPAGAHPSGLIGEDPSSPPTNVVPIILRVAAGMRDHLEVYGGDWPTPDGTGVRDYVHVVDLAAGHVAALERVARDPGVSAWNLGTGRGTSVLELVEAFERASGRPIPREIVDRRPGDIAASWADPSKARRELGWGAARGLDEMCADAWRWQTSASLRS